MVTLGYGWAFTLDAVSYVAVLYALWRMRPSELLRAPIVEKAKGQIRAAYPLRASDAEAAHLLRHARDRRHASATTSTSSLPLLIEHGLHRGDGAFTLVYAAFSAGALVSALIVAGRHLVRVRHVIIGSLGFGVAMLLLAAVPDIGFALAAAFLVGLTSILYMTATTAIVQVEADPGMHGRILALQTVLMIGTAPIGGPILGWMSDAFGPRSTVVLGGVASIVAGGYGMVAVRRARGGGIPAPAAPVVVGSH